MGYFIFIAIIAAIILFFSFNRRKKRKEEERIFLEQKHKAEREKREAAERNEARRQEYLREKRKQEEQRRKTEEMYKQAAITREKRLQERRDLFRQKLNLLPQVSIKLSGEKHNRNSSLYVECKNVTKATSLNKIKDFIAVDTETTGLKAAGNDIIQLSAVKFKNFEPVEVFSTYIKPRKNIPEDATRVNGITDEMVKDAPPFYQIINSFNEFVENLPLVAHNAPFDMKHLYANGLDSIQDKIVYDTLELSKKIIKDAYSYKLQDICEEAHIYFDDAHNANADSLAAGLLFVYLVAERHEMSVEELIETVS